MININPQVLVIGGGSAGIAASIAASRAGAKVVLLERYSFLGGKATGAQVGTICGLYKFIKSEKSEYIVKSFAKEFAEKLKERTKQEPLHNPHGLHYLPYDAFDFKRLCDDLMLENNIDIYFHSTVCGVEASGNSITSIDAIVFDRKIKFSPSTIVDCSGESIISVLANATLIEKEEYQAAAQVFTMENSIATDEAKLGIILMKELKQGIDNGILNDYFDRVSIVPGSVKNNSVQLKIGIPHPISNEANKSTELELLSRRLVSTLSDFMIEHIAIFKNAHLGNVAVEAGIRIGRRAKGKYILTEEDVLRCTKFSDAIANVAWPIEEWGQDKRVKMKYFAENDFYQIPVGCLNSISFDNLFFAGRTISATESAIASARVIGICLQTGYAAGKLAAGKVLKKKEKDILAEIQLEQL